MPCDVEYRWGSPVRLDIFRSTAVAILEGREWRRNIESAPDFLSELWILISGASVRV